MNKFIKMIGLAAVIFVALLAVGIVTLKKMFPPEKVKAMITRKATDFLQREVKVGEVKIGLLSGISISDFAVSESHTFKAGTFISSERFVLKFQLLPLIRKKVVIDEITLEKPQIQIVQRADGKTFNFSDLMKSSSETPKQAEPAKTEEGAPLALTVSKATIIDGNINFIDQGPQKNRIALKPINLSVTATGLDKPMSIVASVQLEGVWTGKKLSASLDTKSVIEIPAQRLDIDSLALKTDLAALEVKGKVSSLMIKPQVDLSVSLKDLDFTKLSQWVALPKELKLSGSPEATVKLKGSQNNLEAELILNLTKVALSYTDAFNKSAGTELTADIKMKLFKQMDLRLDSFKLKLASMEAGVTGEVNKAASATPELNLKLNIAPFDIGALASLSKLAAPYNASGKISFDANIRGSAKQPKFNGLLVLGNLGAKVQTFNLEALNGKISLTENSVDLPALTGKISAAGKSPAEFKITAGVRNFQNPDISLDADFGALDLGMFMGDGKSSPAKASKEKTEGAAPQASATKPMEIKAQGKVHIAKVTYTKFDGQKFEANWKLTGITPTLEKLNGQMEVQIGQGKINNIPALQILAPFLKTDSSGGLMYSRIGGHWNIINGNASTSDFQINSPTADIFAKGSVYLPKSSPDLSLIVKLPKGSVGGTLGQYTNDAEGRSTLTFKMKGDWKPSLDSAAVTKQATEEIKKKAGDLLQKEGQKLLEGIFKR